LQSIELSGGYSEMGQGFGEAFRAQIAQLYEVRRHNALTQALRFGGRHATEDDFLALAKRCLVEARRWDPFGSAELEGIARGAGIAPEAALALGGLTDLRDVLAWGGDDFLGGCTAVLAQTDTTTQAELLFAQTWDLGTANMPHLVRVHRKPSNAPATWTITTVGCLSLMGLNDRGICVGTTNLRTTDVRVGIPYLNILHRCLAANSHAEAIREVQNAPRAAAHAYFVADAHGRASLVEATGMRSRCIDLRQGVYVQTNHCQIPEHAALEGDTPMASSRARLLRMHELMEKSRPRIDRATLQRCLADHEGGERAICRHDFDGISTNAALVVAPESGRGWYCHGNPCTAEWHELIPG